MRNPNGYGSVYKLSGKRRKPWTARVTIGWKTVDEKLTAYPIYKFIGYYETRSDALRALAKYNGEETVIDKKETLLSVYEAWSAEHYPTIKNTGPYRSAFKVLAPLYKTPIEKLMIRDYEDVFQKSDKNIGTLKQVKLILKMMYAYAYRKGIIPESKAALPSYIEYQAGQGNTVDHVAFTSEEIGSLWKFTEDNNVRIILFMIYTGLRISELKHLRSKDVDLEHQCFKVRASKTEAGIRTVPIADKIMFIVSSWMENGTEELVTLPSEAYFRRAIFRQVTEQICGKAHLPHDTRYTTATRMTELGIDVRHIKIILGHSQNDVTNKVYARKIDIKVLLDAVNQIP